MLYKPAAYVYLVALTITSLFTTSEAEININAGRDEVRRLLNRFIDIALNSKSRNPNALNSTAIQLISESKLQSALSIAAQDQNFSGSILHVINNYEQYFRTHGGIPIFNTFTNLRKHCQSTGVSSQSITLRPLVEESAMDETVDNKGFKIAQGILAVRKVLDGFLQIALEKLCNNLETLKDFAEKALEEEGALYKYVHDVAQNYEVYVEGYIGEFIDKFHNILLNGGEYDTNMPIQDKLKNLRAKAHGSRPGSIDDGGSSSQTW